MSAFGAASWTGFAIEATSDAAGLPVSPTDVVDVIRGGWRLLRKWNPIESVSFNPARMSANPVPEIKFKKKYRGGKHGSIKHPIGDRLDSHHMPSKQSSPLDIDEGPAIQMEPADHRRTASYGGRAGSPQQAYRDKQKGFIQKGRFDDAFEMDIDDIQDKFGDKYDQAILEAMEELPK